MLRLLVRGIISAILIVATSLVAPAVPSAFAVTPPTYTFTYTGYVCRSSSTAFYDYSGTACTALPSGSPIVGAIIHITDQFGANTYASAADAVSDSNGQFSTVITVKDDGTETVNFSWTNYTSYGLTCTSTYPNCGSDSWYWLNNTYANTTQYETWKGALASAPTQTPTNTPTSTSTPTPTVTPTPAPTSTPTPTPIPSESITFSGYVCANSTAHSYSTTVCGIGLQTPMVGANVSVEDALGTSLATNTTNSVGHYSITVSVPTSTTSLGVRWTNPQDFNFAACSGVYPANCYWGATIDSSMAGSNQIYNFLVGEPIASLTALFATDAATTSIWDATIGEYVTIAASAGAPAALTEAGTAVGASFAAPVLVGAGTIAMAAATAPIIWQLTLRNYQNITTTVRCFEDGGAYTDVVVAPDGSAQCLVAQDTVQANGIQVQTSGATVLVENATEQAQPTATTAPTSVPTGAAGGCPAWQSTVNLDPSAIGVACAYSDQTISIAPGQFTDPVTVNITSDTISIINLRNTQTPNHEGFSGTAGMTGYTGYGDTTGAVYQISRDNGATWVYLVGVGGGATWNETTRQYDFDGKLYNHSFGVPFAITSPLLVRLTNTATTTVHVTGATLGIYQYNGVAPAPTAVPTSSTVPQDDILDQTAVDQLTDVQSTLAEIQQTLSDITTRLSTITSPQESTGSGAQSFTCGDNVFTALFNFASCMQYLFIPTSDPTTTLVTVTDPVTDGSGNISEVLQTKVGFADFYELLGYLCSRSDNQSSCDMTAGLWGNFSGDSWTGYIPWYDPSTGSVSNNIVAWTVDTSNPVVQILRTLVSFGIVLFAVGAIGSAILAFFGMGSSDTNEPITDESNAADDDPSEEY